MATAQQILDLKGHDVFAVHPDDTVFEALRLMDRKNIGAVLVTDGEKLVGIFTERHYARKVFLKGRSSPDTPVRGVMECNVICVEPNQTSEACMALMSKKKIRHLPVLHEHKVVGVVSIGDLMRSIIAEREFDIDQLVSYVRG